MYRQSEKNLLSSNISPTCPHNMVNFGPVVWARVGESSDCCACCWWHCYGHISGISARAAVLASVCRVHVLRPTYSGIRSDVRPDFVGTC